MKIPTSHDSNNLGLGQKRTLTFADIVEALDSYIEPRHYDLIRQIERGEARSSKGLSFSQACDYLREKGIQ